MKQTTVLVVLVPKPGTPPARVIDAGSGIVADDSNEQRRPITWDEIEVYFEGDRYRLPKGPFVDRVVRAAGRLAERYPTIARGVFRRDDFVVIGTLVYASDWRTHTLDITDDVTLARWLEGT